MSFGLRLLTSILYCILGFLFVKENLPDTPCGIVFVIDMSDAEFMCESRRELVSLVHDTRKLSQPILILVSMDNTSSEKDEADLIAECDFQDMIAGVRSLS